MRPGHFGALAIGGRDASTLLRRAFSIHRADPRNRTVEFVFSEAGRGTRALARHRPGDTVDLIAPLGTPFPLPDGPVGAVLVAGGCGSAPMFALAEEIRGRGGRVACSRPSRRSPPPPEPPATPPSRRPWPAASGSA